MIHSCKGLLFDNDGVLVDSHDAAIEAWGIWSSEFAPHFDWNQPQNAGRRAEDKVREQVELELFEVANNRINELEQATAHMTVALPGAVSLTSSLPAGSWTVCTSANTRLGIARLQAAGIPVPPELVTGDDVSRGKPFADPYLLGASRLGFAVADCVVFEDAEAGVQAGLAAGVGLIVGVSERALETTSAIVVRDLRGISFDGSTLVIPDEIRLR